MKLSRPHRLPAGFTLIEIMVVIAIIGLVMAMGVPSIMNAFKREGMRKAIWQIDETCKLARSDAILHNQITWVIFYPQQGNPHYQYGGAPLFGDTSLETATASPNASAGSSSSSNTMKPASSDRLPDGVEMAMFDINHMDFAESPFGRVRFFPDGTCDELTMILIDKDQRRKLTLEYATAMLDVSEVDQ